VVAFTGSRPPREPVDAERVSREHVDALVRRRFHDLQDAGVVSALVAKLAHIVPAQPPART
jgi:hypothetical protein